MLLLFIIIGPKNQKKITMDFHFRTTAAAGAACLLLLGSPARAFTGSARDRFLTREAFAAHINARPGMTWRAGVPERFKGKPIGASTSLLGAETLSKDEQSALVSAGRLAVASPSASLASSTDPPDSFDAAVQWPMCKETIGDIRDQSDCGTFCRSRGRR